MNKWYLRKANNKYELYCVYGTSEDEEIPIVKLMNILNSEYRDIIIKDEESDIMNGIYTKNLMINDIDFSIYEELSSLTFSSISREGDSIIYYISSILEADIQ